MYINLHVHSEYSLLDGMCRVTEIVEHSKKNNLEYSSITDHGVLYSIPHHQRAASEEDITPIIGFEAYVVKNHQDKLKEDHREHLLLFAKNNDGYKALKYICSEGATRGFYYKPRIDDNILIKYGTKDLIATSACFLKDTEIITNSGIKYIQDVTTDEKVLTHTGNWQQVTKSFNLDYNDVLYTIQTYGNSLPISCTKDHKFLVLEKECIDNYINYEPMEELLDGISLKSQRQRIRKNNRKFPLIWKEAQDLKQDDVLVCPIEQTIKDIKELNISFVDRPKHKYTTKINKLKSYNIPVTNELLEVIGLFVAEGCIHPTYIAFTFNIKATNLEEKVKQVMQEVFGLNCSIRINEQQNKRNVIVHSIEIAMLFENWCGKDAVNKKMPEFVKYLPPKKQLFFLKGCYLGDGYKSDTKTTYATISKQLYYDLTFILKRNNINASGWISQEHTSKDGAHHCKAYYLGVDYPTIRNHLQKFIWDNEPFEDLSLNQLRAKDMPLLIDGIKYCRLPIRKITTEQAKTKVYCLEVENDHSFIANNICVHNCLAGRIPYYLLKDDYDTAKHWCEYYAKLFKDSFYLEIQPVEDSNQVKVNKGLIQLSQELGLPLIATTDSHYTYPSQKEAHEMLLCMQSKDKWANPNRWKFKGNTFWLMNEEQIIDAFRHNGHEELNQNLVLEAIHNTMDLAKRCNVSFNFDKIYLPKLPVPTDDEVFNKKLKVWKEKHPDFVPEDINYLRHKCYEGLKKIKPEIKYNREQFDIYKARIERELKTIQEMGFASYFLIVDEYVHWAKEIMPVGPGRGCFTEDALVNTNTGTKQIKDIQLFDKVKGVDEKEHCVFDILKYAINETITHLKTKNKEIKSTNDHLIYAIKEEDFNNGIRTPKWYKASELNIGDYIAEIEEGE